MKSKALKYLLLFTGLAIGVGIILIIRLFFGMNVSPSGQEIVLYIPEGASYNQAMDSMKAHIPIRHQKTFSRIAIRKNYQANVKPGRYVIDHKMSYIEIINMLRSGNQAPVNVTFNNIRTLYDLAGKIGGEISADSSQIIEFLMNPANYSKDGFNQENIISVFIPNTYQFFWNTDAEDLYSRMLREYKKFWNDDRMAKAKGLNLDPVEVSTLASIIDFEAAKSDEKPRIAGVYLNRLKRGLPLQADPTIKFAMNDFTISRVLKKHLKTDSPYNTYKYTGLPPGPIGCPTIESIDAVLNAENHDYLYFVAKADFSGYHHFSRTLSEHNRYAANYQRELNKRRIFK